MKKLLTIVSVVLCLVSCQSKQDKVLDDFKAEVTDDLVNNLLPWWMDNVLNDTDYWGEVAYDGTPNPEGEKGGIVSARLIWTFSGAYRVLGDEKYKEAADKLADYFIKHFMDEEFGGVFYTLKADGEPSQVMKSTYSNAFAIYGLAEHYRATGNQASLDAAKAIFQAFEDHIYDAEKGGYIESHTRDWQRPELRPGRPMMTKTMNTHIHIMEAFTNLYRVWPDETLRARLIELVNILQTHLYNSDTHHLILYCDDDWNHFNDADSYGHDIETSWLLTETAEILGDEALLESIKKQAIDMCSTTLKEGLRPDNAMMNDKRGDHYVAYSSWWCQSETMVGCINAWQITGDFSYVEQAIKTWGFVKEFHIDKENGGWWLNLNDDNTPKLDEFKASMWNCPYHNSRAAYEIIERLALMQK